MTRILIKYLYLNRKNLVFGLLSACFFGLIALDSSKYYAVALLMAPSLLFSFVVGKMCYEEDSRATKEFLLALPVRKRNIALEKNIVGQICIVAGMVIVNIMFLLINVITGRGEAFFSIGTDLLIACFLLIYNTIYIYLNYRFDYSRTQFAGYIILALMFVLFKFGNELTGRAEIPDPFILTAAVLVLSGISLFITGKQKWDA